MDKKFNWMPILKTGTFTARNGKTVEFDEEKLDRIIACTDLTTEPQFVIEHPQYDKLGFGTIEKLKRVGKYLFALPKKVDDKFKEIVNKGELPGRSVCLDENTFALSSIGFLPQSILPAVDGLGSYEFANQQNITTGKENSIEFSFNSAESQFMEEEGSQTEPFEQNSYSNTSVNSNDKSKIDLSSVDTSRMDLQLKLALETLINDNKQLETNLAAAKTELQAAAQTITNVNLAQSRKEILAFCQSEEMKLKILPSEADKVSALLLAVKEKGTLEFSTDENESSKFQFNAYDYLKDVLKHLPNKIELSEMATHQNAGSMNVTEYQKVGSEIAGFVNHKK